MRRRSSSSARSSFIIHHSAFTLFELLIAIAVIGLILASVIPYIMAKREMARRVQCASNLKLIRDAMKDYARDFNQYYPRTVASTTQPDGWTAFTGADEAEPFSANSTVKPNDVTASLWLLVRGGYISDTSAFVCPSADDWPDRLYDANNQQKVSAKRRGNFRSSHNLSYSVFCPFGSAIGNEVGKDKDTVWKDTLPSDCAILADKNPGTAGGSDVTRVPATAPAEDYAASNSPNHGRAGQNVLYADSSVQFERTPYVGVGYKRSVKNEQTNAWSESFPGDNIYTALKSKPISAGQTPPNYDPGVVGQTLSPAWQYDSYLVPTAGE